MAVVPHYDNAEGGTHDTRYCYLGEERLRVMEAQLPPEGWALGVDEHTVCIFDLDVRTVTVSGLGTVTVRRHGTSVIVASGRTLSIDELVELAGSLPAASGATPLSSVRPCQPIAVATRSLRRSGAPPRRTRAARRRL